MNRLIRDYLSKKFQTQIGIFVLLGLIFAFTACLSQPVPADSNPTAARPTPAIPKEYSCVPARNSREVAVVEKIIDGDSILVKMNGLFYEVRYVGINTPEFDSPQEKEAEFARQKNIALVSGKTIWMVKDVRDKDKYQRLLRFVFVGDTFVNLELVRIGVAEVKDYPPDTSCQAFFRKNIPGN
jgi:micrococcal nuclease